MVTHKDSIFGILPVGTYGEYLLTPAISRERGIHVYEVIQHLENRSMLLDIPLRIEANIDPKGVRISWKEK